MHQMNYNVYYIIYIKRRESGTESQGERGRMKEREREIERAKINISWLSYRPSNIITAHLNLISVKEYCPVGLLAPKIVFKNIP